MKMLKDMSVILEVQLTRGDNYQRPPVETQGNQPVEALMVDSAKSTDHERQKNQKHS